MTFQVEAARQGFSAPGYPMARLVILSTSLAFVALGLVAFGV